MCGLLMAAGSDYRKPASNNLKAIGKDIETFLKKGDFQKQAHYAERHQKNSSFKNIAGAGVMKKRILIFTGEGKGKTTAALGMALRAWGHGMRVVVAQFVKDFSETGEFKAINNLQGIDIVQLGLGFPPSDKKSSEFEKHRQKCHDSLKEVETVIKDGTADFLMLDEICFAVSYGLVGEENVINLLKSVPDDLIIVLTGRGATDGLLEIADTVTEMKCLKHAYYEGVEAQTGVEF